MTVNAQIRKILNKHDVELEGDLDSEILVKSYSNNTIFPLNELKHLDLEVVMFNDNRFFLRKIRR